MGKSKQVNKEDVVSAPKQMPFILATYKPLPKFGGGCAVCK